MKIKTIASVALLTVSTAALAQMTTQPRPAPGNTTTAPSTSMPGNSMMNSMPPASDSMNTQDETMMNDSSMPDPAATPNATMPPR